MPATAMPWTVASRVRAGRQPPITRPDVGRERVELAMGGRIARQETLGVAHGAHLGRDVEAESLRRRARHVLGRAAADVDHHGLGPFVLRAIRGGAEEGEPRLLVPRDRARVDPEALVQLVSELRPVRGVAHGARGDRDHLAHLEPVDHFAIDGERVPHPVHRLVGQPARGIHALPEPGDGGALVELVELAGTQLRHEQPSGVRPEIDDTDPRVRGLCHAWDRTRTRQSC